MSPTKIEWVQNADGTKGETWNPIRGTAGRWHCTKVSPGCTNCYAERMNVRFKGPRYTKGADTLRLDRKVLEQPLRWKKPRTIFTLSMSDLFHESIGFEWIDLVFGVMALAPQHRFQILTKRASIMHSYLSSDGRPYLIQKAMDKIRVDLSMKGRPEEWRPVVGWEEHYEVSSFGSKPPSISWPLPNLWLGVSAEDQQRADERIPPLLQTPAAVRFVSAEPLLGPLDIRPYLPNQIWNDLPSWKQPELDWVIGGGGSGPKARPMHPDWARSIRDQCQESGVPYFFKQWGHWAPVCEVYCDDPVNEMDGHTDQVVPLDPDGHIWYEWQPPPGSWYMDPVGKKRAGRLLDGREWNQMPEIHHA